MSGNNKLLVYKLSGSPFSGSNWCREVDESGTYRTVHLSDFMSSVGRFIHIADRYKKCIDVFKAYSLEEVVDILKRDEEESRVLPQDYAVLFIKSKNDK